jgi:amino acid transporter
MNHNRNVPDNAVYLTSIAAGILCLVNLGSTFAFNIIVSLTLLALLLTYMITIDCVLRKRLLGKELPSARRPLGRFGIPIDGSLFLYSGL